MLSKHSPVGLHTVLDDGYVGAQGCHFSGRLTRARVAPRPEGGTFHSLKRTTRMLFTSGAEGRVSWRVGEYSWTTRTDTDGYWELNQFPPPDLPPGWHSIEAQPAASSPAHLFLPAPSNRFGIISDVDDTILVSNVLKRGTLLRNSLAVPAESRTAVPRMATLYTKLLAQNPEPHATPVFYLSSSPKQLTDNLRRFLAAHGFPTGVLLLKEVASEYGESLRVHTAYKRRRLDALFQAYPNVRFALFGDDAESDPEVYSSIEADYPNQVAGIWIRSVRRRRGRIRLAGQADVSDLLRDL